MKKSVLLTFLAGVLVLFGCTQDNELAQMYNSLEKRVATLEEQVKYLNETTIPSLQNVISAIRSGKDLPFVYIRDIAQLAEGGYSITFSNGTTAVIKDGAQGPIGPGGPEGPEGPSPEMGVTEIEGVFYWTANGELITDKDGNPVPVHAALPTLRIKDGKWQVSYDNGETWADVPQMGQGGSAIEIIDKETEVIFIINGESHSIKKELPFFLVFDQRTDIGVPQGETYMFEYNIQGITETDQVEVDILSCTAGWEAEVVSVATADAPGYISIKNVDNSNGKIFIYAANGKGKTDIKSLQFEGGKLEVIADVQPVEAAGGEVSFSVTTNMNYDVNVDEDQDWLTLAVDTKATHTDVVKLNAAENTTGSFRSANAYVVNPQTGETVETITVLQYPCETVTTDIASLANVADGTPVKIFGAAVMATSKSSAVVSDGTTLLYTIGKSIPAGKEVTLIGVKTSADGVPVLEGTTFDITAESTSITAPEYDYVGYAVNIAPARTMTTGVLEKEDDIYFISSPKAIKLIFEDPTDDMALDSRLGKTINVTGYPIGEGEDEDSFVMVLESVKNITVAKQSNWALSYEYDATQEYPEIITNTVSGTTANYMFGIFDKTVVEEELGITTPDEMGEYAATMAPDDLQYSAYFYYRYFYGYDPAEVIEILTHTGTTDSEGFESLDFGKYYAVAVGVDDAGIATGDYAAIEFEKKDPYVAAAYEDFLGKWSFGGAIYEITEKVKGQSYELIGNFEPLGGVFPEATYDAELGAFVLYEQELGSFSDEMGEDTDYLSGLFSTYYGYPWNGDADLLLSLRADEEGNIHIVPGKKVLSSSYPFIGMAIGNSNDDYSICRPFAEILEPALGPEDEYLAFLGNWDVTDDNGETVTITIKEDVTNKTVVLNGLGIDNYIKLNYDSSTKSLSANYGQFASSSTYYYYVAGITNDGYVAVASGTEGSALVKLTVNEDGTQIVQAPVKYNYSGGRTGVYAAYWGIMGKRVADNKWVSFTNCTLIDSSKPITKSASASVAATRTKPTAGAVLGIGSGIKEQKSSTPVYYRSAAPADNHAKKIVRVKEKSLNISK